MTQGRKPDVTLTAKPKGGSNDDRVQLIAGWNGQYGVNCKLGRDVAKIVLTDGTEITGDGHYLDLKVWTEIGGGREPRREEPPEYNEPPGVRDGGGFDDLPFMPVDERLS
jgi:hypothetical protein